MRPERNPLQLVIILLVSGLPVLGQELPPIEWVGEEEGFARAAETRRPVVLFVWAFG